MMDYVLIDDDPITLFVTKQIFQFEGLSAKLTDFNDPEKALEFLRQQISVGRIPQVIFLDLNMPKISGWDLLKALEPHKEQLQEKCHIYLLTSSIDPSDINRAKAHPQVKDLIHKPINRDKIHTIKEVMGRKQ